MSIPIALIEDEPAYQRALARVLAASDRHTCAGYWPTVEAALPALAAAKPSLLLLDIDLPGMPGHAAIPRLLETCPGLLIVMLTAHDSDKLVFAALEAGAIGYLLKAAEPDDILAGVEDALAGGAPMSPAIARKVVGFFGARRVSAPESPAPLGSRDAALAALTEREEELLALIAAGASDKAAAEQLGITHGSVRNRLHGIYRKLQVSSRTEAAARYRTT